MNAFGWQIGNIEQREHPDNRIRIFTISGQELRELGLPLPIVRNVVDWDVVDTLISKLSGRVPFKDAEALPCGLKALAVFGTAEQSAFAIHVWHPDFPPIPYCDCIYMEPVAWKNRIFEIKS